MDGPKDNRISVTASDEYVERVDARRDGVEESRAEWFRDAGNIKSEIEDAVEAAGMADELDDDWWRDELYDLVRERADELRDREVAQEQDREREVEADD